MAQEKPKLGLVLSGGGAKGAFQVGVLDYLVNDRKVDFRIIGGVSTGALQAVMVAQGEVKRLREIWESIKSTEDIYTERIGGIRELQQAAASSASGWSRSRRGGIGSSGRERSTYPTGSWPARPFRFPSSRS